MCAYGQKDCKINWPGDWSHFWYMPLRLMHATLTVENQDGMNRHANR